MRPGKQKLGRFFTRKTEEHSCEKNNPHRLQRVTVNYFYRIYRDYGRDKSRLSFTKRQIPVAQQNRLRSVSIFVLRV